MYPALAVAEALNVRHPGVRLFFVGTVGGFERPLVEKAGMQFAAYDEVLAGPWSGVPLVQRVLSLFKLLLGTLQALWLVLRRRPQVLLLTGGWVGFPVALAAWLLRVPALIYLPDIEPGLTIRVLKRFVRRVAVTAPAAAVHFRAGQTVVTGYPLRSQLLQAARSSGGEQAREQAREQAQTHFGLDTGRPTLLVLGGSRGARSINTAVLALLPELLGDGVQVLHVTGTLDWAALQAPIAALPHQELYHPFAYLHADIGLALAAADVVLSRAGASVLGEYPLFGLASVLVPYPYAWRYQKVNADYLQAHGAGLRLDDEHMAAELLPVLRGLLGDSERLAAMRAASAALAVPDAAGRIAAELSRLAGQDTRDTTHTEGTQA